MASGMIAIGENTGNLSETLVYLSEFYESELDELVKKRGKSNTKATVSDYIIKIARLGGYLDRASDPPPGNLVMWRGLSKLNDIHLGFRLGSKTCG